MKVFECIKTCTLSEIIYREIKWDIIKLIHILHRLLAMFIYKYIFNFIMVNTFLKAKILAFFGAMLSFIGITSPTKITLYFGFEVVGMLLFMLSIKIISDYYGDNNNFKYAFMALIVSLTGYTLSFVLTGVVAIEYESIYFPLTTHSQLFIGTLIISAIFLYIPYSKITKLTGIKDFDAGSFLMIIGFILAPIGFILLIIGIIYMYYAYSALDNNKSKNNLPSTNSIQ